jgi:(2Fe-2S) ferredoxin
MVVYPDGAWYCRAKPEFIEQIIPKHLIGRMVVEEYAFLTHLLPIIPLLAYEHWIEA